MNRRTRGAEHGSGQPTDYAELLARCTTMLLLLHDALGPFSAEFDADEEVPGADLVDRFASWRTRAKAELAAVVRPAG